MLSSGWDDQRLNRLKELHADGCSTSVIAQDLGGITRNAVISQIHRLHERGLLGSPLHGKRGGNRSHDQISHNGPAKVAKRKKSKNVGAAPSPRAATDGGAAALDPSSRSFWARNAGPGSRPVPLIELRNRKYDPVTNKLVDGGTCRWPLAAFDETAALFCGSPLADDGLPYCKHHCRRAYNSGATAAVNRKAAEYRPFKR